MSVCGEEKIRRDTAFDTGARQNKSGPVCLRSSHSCCVQLGLRNFRWSDIRNLHFQREIVPPQKSQPIAAYHFMNQPETCENASLFALLSSDLHVSMHDVNKRCLTCIAHVLYLYPACRSISRQHFNQVFIDLRPSPSSSLLFPGK